MVNNRGSNKGVSVKIDVETYKLLKEEKKNTDIPISAIIRKAIKNYINK